MKTEKQIRDALSKEVRGVGFYELCEIDEAIGRLKELGYIDDRAYAERYLEILVGKRHGRRRVKDEMRRCGIAPMLAEDIIEGGYSPEKERENAEALAQKALDTGDLPADRRRAAQRLSSRLAAKGYGYDMINSVVGELLRGVD
jgi:regulatory protein